RAGVLHRRRQRADHGRQGKLVSERRRVVDAGQKRSGAARFEVFQINAEVTSLLVFGSDERTERHTAAPPATAAARNARGSGAFGPPNSTSEGEDAIPRLPRGSNQAHPGRAKGAPARCSYSDVAWHRVVQ